MCSVLCFCGQIFYIYENSRLDMDGSLLRCQYHVRMIAEILELQFLDGHKMTLSDGIPADKFWKIHKMLTTKTRMLIVYKPLNPLFCQFAR